MTQIEVMSRDSDMPGLHRGGFFRWVLPMLGLLLGAAGPQRGLSLEVPSVPAPTLPGSRQQARPAAPVYEPAPLPNRDIDGPVAPRASNSPSLAPSLFTRNDTYRGESLGRGSSAASEQERRVKPGAGFNLRMPFAPN